MQDREFFAAIREGREPNSSVHQVLDCYRVLHDLEQQLEQPGTREGMESAAYHRPMLMNSLLAWSLAAFSLLLLVAYEARLYWIGRHHPERTPATPSCGCA